MAQPTPRVLEYLDRLERFRATARSAGFGKSPLGGPLVGELNRLYALLSPEERDAVAQPNVSLVAPAAPLNGNANGNACHAPPSRRPTFWQRLHSAWRAFQQKG